MSESIIADFTTRLIPDAARYAEPISGRVLLSEQRVVLATDGERTTIPLGQVFDVAYEGTPDEFAEFFDDTLTIGYRTGQSQQLAVVEGEADALRRFAGLLFKAILNGTDAVVARGGGGSPTKGTLGLGDAEIVFVGPPRLVVDVATVISYEQETWETGERTYPALTVRNVPGEDTVVTRFALGSKRKLNVLGRYIQLGRIDIEDDLGDLTLSTEEVGALAALHADPKVNLARHLGTDASHTTMLERRLVEKELLEDDRVTPTQLGRFVAVNRG